MLPLFEGASDRERKRSFPMLLFLRLLPVGTINFTSLQASGPVLCPASNSSINRNLPFPLPMPTAPLALPPSIDIHQALGSPSGRAGAKRLRGITAPILPTGYPQIHCSDSLYEIAFLHELSAHPSPPPFGRYLDRRERQGAVWKLKTER